MEPFKNIFNKEAVLHIGLHLERAGVPDARNNFKPILRKLNNLELKQRVDLISELLVKLLPSDPKESFEILKSTLAPLTLRGGLGNSSKDTFTLNPLGLDGFLLWPLSVYVEKVGINHTDLSMKFLYEITKRFTSEFAIRSFIISDPAKVYLLLSQWCNDESEHVRRLCSEGTRPRLPWGKRLHSAVLDPSLGLMLLEKLKWDESMYVRKSIANHLNDISKDHPALVIKTLKKWLKKSPKKHKDKIKWITRHSLRTLIKNSHKDAHALQGVKTDAKLFVQSFKMSQKKIKIGQSLKIEITIKNKDLKEQLVIADMQFNFLKKNGTYSKKVFKGSSFKLKSQEAKTLNLNFSFKMVSTRKYYLGSQFIELLINSKVAKTCPFTLI